MEKIKADVIWFPKKPIGKKVCQIYYDWNGHDVIIPEGYKFVRFGVSPNEKVDFINPYWQAHLGLTTHPSYIVNGTIIESDGPRIIVERIKRYRYVCCSRDRRLPNIGEFVYNYSCDDFVAVTDKAADIYRTCNWKTLVFQREEY